MGVHRPEEVAQLQSQELKLSKAALNISDVIELGYPDSGMPGAAEDIAPDAFSRRDGEPIVRRLEAVMRAYQPDVVVTYPPNGKDISAFWSEKLNSLAAHVSGPADMAGTAEVSDAAPSSGRLVALWEPADLE
nr:PIG-L family deacetylase [Streptomyces bauhiniae]